MSMWCGPDVPVGVFIFQYMSLKNLFLRRLPHSLPPLAGSEGGTKTLENE